MFQPLPAATLPDADPELMALWENAGDALAVVDAAMNRFNLPQNPKNYRPPLSVPLKPLSTATPVLGKVVCGEDIINLPETLEWVK